MRSEPEPMQLYAVAIARHYEGTNRKGEIRDCTIETYWAFDEDDAQLQAEAELGPDCTVRYRLWIEEAGTR
jgi:hypothetical protein